MYPRVSSQAPSMLLSLRLVWPLSAFCSEISRKPRTDCRIFCLVRVSGCPFPEIQGLSWLKTDTNALEGEFSFPVLHKTDSLLPSYRRQEPYRGSNTGFTACRKVVSRPSVQERRNSAFGTVHVRAVMWVWSCFVPDLSFLSGQICPYRISRWILACLQYWQFFYSSSHTTARWRIRLS